MRDRHTGELHVGQRAEGRQLDVGEHRGDRRGHLFADPLGHAQGVPAQLTGCRALGLGHELARIGLGQLLVEVAAHEVAEGLVGKARPHEPAGEDRVERQPAERDAGAAERLHLGLGVGEHLRGVRFEPVAQRLGDVVAPGRLDRGIQRRDADPRGQAALDRDGERELTLLRVDPGAGAGGVDLGRDGRRDGGFGGGCLVGVATQSVEDARQERAELQAREDVAHRLRVDRLHGEVVRPDRQLDIAQQRVQRPVAAHVVEVLAEVAADDAGDLVGVLEQRVEAPPLVQPLDRGLLADLRHAGQVVARLADEGGDVGIVRRRQAVLLDDRIGRVALQLRHALHARVQQGHIVGDELDRVAVAGADEHVVPRSRALSGEGGEDVVGLDPLLGEHGDVHRREGLLQERDLTGELGR